MNFLTALFFAAKSILIGCPFDHGQCLECNDYRYGIRKIGHLPKEVKESSGIVAFNDLFLTQPDSGNPPKVWGVKYPFDKNSSINGELELGDDIKNIDWEDLARDDEENLYIGDFGNNNQRRKDLKIIKYDLVRKKHGEIRFAYADQENFNPAKNKDQNYDCEAMLWSRGKLYLFSKNRGNKNVKIYQFPDQLGEYTAEIIDTLKLSLQITGADISPDGQFVALLAYGKVLIYRTSFDSDDNLSLIPFHCKHFSQSGQSEAITFIDEDNLLITNEKGKVFWMYVKKDRRKREIIKPEIEEVFPNTDKLELKELQ